MEEFKFATRLDVLGSVRCRFRNPGGGSFACRGFRAEKFNPDYLTSTRGGGIVALKYEGEEPATIEDPATRKGQGTTGPPWTPRTAASRCSPGQLAGDP